MCGIKTFLYAEINIFALVVLFLIFLNIHRRGEKYLLEQKLFLALLYSNVLVLVLDSLMWILDGRTGLWMREANLIVTACYYSMNPIICMIWSFYADYHIYRNERHLKKIMIPLLTPAVINMVLSFLSLFYGYLFYVGANNVYHRGKLFLLMAAISYAYLMYTFIVIILKQNRIQKRFFIPILVFAVPPFLGGIIQILFYGISLIWVCMAISVLIVFINIQNDQLNTDYLTGLYNRRQLESYLKQVQADTKRDLIGGLMIDLNMFKLINDVHGHDVGDEALKYTATILKNTFRRKDFIARYGGDEFIVMMEIKNELDLVQVVQRLKENVAQFNMQKIVPYSISLSIGYDCYDSNAQYDIWEFVKQIDRLMYKHKQEQDALLHTELKE